MDYLFLRGIERLVIAFAAFGFSYLGYRLYLHGIQSGKNQMRFRSSFMNFVLVGAGPGLFFMALGGIVLLVLVLKAPTRQSVTTTQEESSTIAPTITVPKSSFEKWEGETDAQLSTEQKKVTTIVRKRVEEKKEEAKTK